MRKEEFQRVMANSELPYAAKLLYQYLRYHMDYATGVVGGPARRISYTGIREYLEYLPLPKSTDKVIQVTINRARKLINRLESLEVIVALHNKTAKESMVFFMPLAKPELVCPVDEEHMRNIPLDRENTGGSQVTHRDEAHTSTNLVTTHKLNTLFSAESKNPPELMPSGWQPSLELVMQLQGEFGFEKSFVRDQAFLFGLYWRERKGRASSWDIKFYNRVKGRLADGDIEFTEALGRVQFCH